jgi:N-acyl-phosphatidylethanolamine-hydrolysing phospholipase D
MGNAATSESREGLPSHHVGDGTYTMPLEWRGEMKFPSATDLLSLQVDMAKNRPTIPTAEELPIVPIDWELVNKPTSHETIQYTWLGHSTFLCQIGGFNILTDPVFSERASPVQFAGPARYRPIPCTVEQLPSIDIVVISHNHYDHLDYYAVLDLFEKHKNATFYVPLGIKQWCLDSIPGIERVVELDWWQSHTHETATAHGNIELTFLPVQHWSMRTGRDRNHALWGAWALVYKPNEIDSPNKVLFHCGDTGYNEFLFKEIGEKFSRPNGGIDFAMIPIGAYEPRWFMQPQHVDPDEAMMIAKEIEAKHCVGMHWGTFILTCEPILEPKQRIEELSKQDPKYFITLRHGETFVVQ